MNNVDSPKNHAKSYADFTKTLLRSVPKTAVIIFVLAVIGMNFLSRISLLNLPLLALNAGILISWVSFLFLDVFVKNFGAKAANFLSMLAVFANLLCSLFCVIISRICNNPSLDTVVGGQWSILTASTIAYIISAVTNNYSNIFIGRKISNSVGEKSAFALRSFISTFLSQVLDNFIFVFLAFVVLPYMPGAFHARWTVIQCVGCSFFCAIIELLTEMLFSPIGYHISKKWKEKGVGKEYIENYGNL